VGVLEGRGDAAEDLELHAALPHLHDGAVLRADTHERRLGLRLLEVAADRDRLRDAGAVVELEQRRAAERVLVDVGRLPVLACRPDVDLHGRHREALLGEEDPHAARIRRHLRVVELHGTSGGGRA
jgi:hypothetical protein